MPTKQQLLLQAEVAAYLRVEEATLENWRYRRVGPRFIKVGHGVRYRESDVEAYLRAQTEETTPGRAA